MTENTDKEREAFEKWARETGFNTDRDETDKYRDFHRATTRFAWMAWQARAALEATPTAQPAQAEGGDALDAKRYRWLRETAHPDRDDIGLACMESAVSDWGKTYWKHYSGKELDTAIDAARAAQGETK